jgi:hypothetical protein
MTVRGFVRARQANSSELKWRIGNSATHPRKQRAGGESALRSTQLRLDGHLDYAIPPLSEKLVSVCNLVQRECMRQKWNQVEPSMAD